jgi:hypothetical protein
MNPLQLLIEAYLEKMRLIPALVALVGNNASNILAHHIHAPLDSDIFQVIAGLPTPCAMIYYAASGVTSRSSRELYGHELRIAIRLNSELDNFAFIWAFENSIPTGLTTQLRRWAAGAQFYPMDPYSVARVAFAVTQDTTISYPEIRFTVTQKI